MSNAYFRVPKAENEPVKGYAGGSKERELLKAAIAEMKAVERDIPMYIDGKEVRTGKTVSMHPPHELTHTLGQYHKGDAGHINQAIDAALKAKKDWENMPWEQRASIFLKAADLLAGPYRYKMNAATMLCQSKNPFQAEIDAACELIDFWRFNVEYMAQLYTEQPESQPGMWNRLEHRALEGFVFALTPFNFTSIGGNLPTAPALMGNTVVWKPANSQIYSAWVIMEILREAGLPDGVINLVYVGGVEAGEVIFKHPDFAGIHFTGSTATFQTIWKTIGNNISTYKSYPRIVGETGGKDFVIAHPSADVKALATALVRGAFEFQGQKCSAASRAYIPSNLWDECKELILKDIASIKMGTVEDFSNFFNAVIDEKAFDSIAGYIDKDAGYRTMCEEIFGPVLTIYVYEPEQWSETLTLLDNTSPYALTGAVFSQDRYAVQEAIEKLRHSAGNFYINDKPTGAVVGQQPFGGARASGTNDKAGSILNLLRWVSPRTIKETFVPPIDYRYPFMMGEK
jgi:1-pyrroline-5-carboxylate dehydrogenase